MNWIPFVDEMGGGDLKNPFLRKTSPWWVAWHLRTHSHLNLFQQVNDPTSPKARSAIQFYRVHSQLSCIFSKQTDIVKTVAVNHASPGD